MIKTNTMTLKKFNYLVNEVGRKMTGDSTLAAKEVLVNGLKAKDAAEKFDISPAVVSTKVKKILDREKNLIEFLERTGG
ncbi:hypothetical protein [Hydrogenovibrio marinus]|uniref:HTH psq-type domain-containing protein n=1 Tax=Hydrogenovibrio marinus TaxID=28885 RepID=A0A066ZR52_HYDMR|nr:hypothetical protein [Hydrogenovibrio marinus]KDN94719.1 hypothetical protein EI16_12545 [Hydrogenovibrio marinus]